MAESLEGRAVAILVRAFPGIRVAEPTIEPPDPEFVSIPHGKRLPCTRCIHGPGELQDTPWMDERGEAWHIDCWLVAREVAG